MDQQSTTIHFESHLDRKRYEDDIGDTREMDLVQE